MRLVFLFFLLLLGNLLFSQPAYPNRLFDEIAAVMVDGSKYELDEIRREHQGGRISGDGFVTSVSRDSSGKVFVNLSTLKDRTSEASVDIIVFVKDIFIREARRLKRGEEVHFVGYFEGIRLRTMIVSRALVK